MRVAIDFVPQEQPFYALVVSSIASSGVAGSDGCFAETWCALLTAFEQIAAVLRDFVENFGDV